MTNKMKGQKGRDRISLKEAKHQWAQHLTEQSIHREINFRAKMAADSEKAELNIAALKSMFPALETELVKTMYWEHGGDMARCVDVLMVLHPQEATDTTAAASGEESESESWLELDDDIPAPEAVKTPPQPSNEMQWPPLTNEEWQVCNVANLNDLEESTPRKWSSIAKKAAGMPAQVTAMKTEVQPSWGNTLSPSSSESHFSDGFFEEEVHLRRDARRCHGKWGCR